MGIHERTLHIFIGYSLQNQGKPFIFYFVTITYSEGYKEARKRCPFTM